MGMARARCHHFVMSMIVVGIACAVRMHMGMLKRLVGMCMVMFFCQMKPDAPRHQDACHYQLRCDSLTQDSNGQSSTDKRRNGEISSSAGCHHKHEQGSDAWLGAMEK